MPKYNKLLVVSKTTRLERILNKDIPLSPFAEKNCMQDWKEANLVHHTIVDSFMKWAKIFGIETEYVKEDDLTDGDAKGYDLVLAIGGDSTYLKAAG